MYPNSCFNFSNNFDDDSLPNTSHVLPQLFLQETYEMDTTVISILQMRRLRHWAFNNSANDNEFHGISQVLLYHPLICFLM